MSPRVDTVTRTKKAKNTGTNPGRRGGGSRNVDLAHHRGDRPSEPSLHSSNEQKASRAASVSSPGPESSGWSSCVNSAGRALAPNPAPVQRESNSVESRERCDRRRTPAGASTSACKARAKIVAGGVGFMIGSEHGGICIGAVSSDAVEESAHSPGKAQTERSSYCGSRSSVVFFLIPAARVICQCWSRNFADAHA